MGVDLRKQSRVEQIEHHPEEGKEKQNDDKPVYQYKVLVYCITLIKKPASSHKE
jgi:hypothetical protein